MNKLLYTSIRVHQGNTYKGANTKLVEVVLYKQVGLGHAPFPGPLVLLALLGVEIFSGPLHAHIVRWMNLLPLVSFKCTDFILIFVSSHYMYYYST